MNLHRLSLSVCLGPLALAMAAIASSNPTTTNPTQTNAPIPWNEIGARAGSQYSGDGLSVAATEDGAQLRCVFQRLNARATAEGLWITSTANGAKGEAFRVRAVAVGRRENGQPSPREHAGVDLRTGLSAFITMPRTGKVEVAEERVRWVRPGLIEEYSVSMDGVRQDFIVQRQPEGKGPVRVELVLDGAKAEPLLEGARLVLTDGGRKIAYSRLRAADAAGKELPARMDVVEANRLALMVDDTGATYPVRIDPTFSDANWISMGGVPGTDGSVSAAVVDGSGNLYIGGSFTVAGDVVANCIAKWNGTSWSPLGSGMVGESWGYTVGVYALAVLGGDLYAGGRFTAAGGEAANNVAKWNGSSWSALGSGMNGRVAALAVSGNELFAGGAFTTAGGVSAYCVAKWNGSAWSSLGLGVGGGDAVYGTKVYALALSGSELYVGGDFTTAGGLPANYVAKWNGITWSALGSGIRGYVFALAVSGSDLYAGGMFTTAGGVSANNIAKWNGSSWSALGSGMSDEIWPVVSALVVSGSDLYAGGQFTSAGGVGANSIARWNGSTWSSLASGMSGGGGRANVNALAVSGSNLYAGGNEFTTAGGASANSVAKWDGSAWSGLGSGMWHRIQAYVSAVAVSGGDLYVGGEFTTVNGVSVNNIAKWNGSGWSALGSGIQCTCDYPRVSALAASGSDLYVGGLFTAAGGVNATNIAKWNGSSWFALGSGLSRYVNALAVSGSDLYAGGWFTVAKWDGSAWSALGSGMNGAIRALALDANGDLYAGGGFTAAGGVSAKGIAKWNGSAWSPLGLGISGGYSEALVLVVSGSDLYAGGSFTAAGAVSANQIARWDGSAWWTLGSGMNGAVWALALDANGDLYAGGDFTTAGGVSAKGIAKWKDSTWSALGSGMNRTVGTLAVSCGELYAGGYFTTAGDKASAYVAKAQLTPLPPAPPSLTTQPLNQTIGAGANATFTVSATGTPPLNYQWRKNGMDIAGAISPTLTLNSVGASDSGGYSVVVWNAYGSAVSDTAHLAVLADGANGNKPPQISATGVIVQPPGKTKLVIVTHGWLPKEANLWPFGEPPIMPGWVAALAEDIRTYLQSHGATDWEVASVDWALEAWTWTPDQALDAGRIRGGLLGRNIAAQSWQHVHLIGHSAGAGLIQAAADAIRQAGSTTGMKVHVTLLDPYLGFDYGGRSTYGANTDWADSYFVHDRKTDLMPTLLGFPASLTEGRLDNAFSVDVTWTDDTAADSATKLYCPSITAVSTPPVLDQICGYEAWSSHDWPYKFYRATVLQSGLSCAAGYDYGFRFSLEAGNWESRPSRNSPLVALCGPSPTQNVTPLGFNAPIQINLSPNAMSGVGATLFGNGFDLRASSAPQPLRVEGEPGDQSAQSRPAPTGTEPAWLAVGLTITNAANFVQFDAAFAGTNAAEGLLTVYWNTNQIGMVDERVASPGWQTYRFALPGKVTNGLYTLSFRLDAFNSTSSSIAVTNVLTGFAGVDQPITLEIVRLATNNAPVLQLTGAPNFTYLVEASTNLENWTPSALLLNTNGTVLFVDPAVTNSSQRFYRAVLP